MRRRPPCLIILNPEASGRLTAIKRSIYIHIPFCSRRCPYCGFYSTPYNDSLASSYVDIICRQLNTVPGRFDTIYIGGGTPTVLTIESLDRLLTALNRRADNAAEFTIEANPDSACEEKLSLLLDKGVNRISIGVQSLDDAKLNRLGRIHDASCAEKCVLSARKEGFRNISMDLIFGVRKETLNDWKKDLAVATNLPVKHISCYALDCKKLEDQEHAAELYEYAMDYLPQKGFVQYEISNFARHGYGCRHNLNYWNNDPYIGLGPSAVSYICGRREENAPNISDYIKKARSGRTVVISGERLGKVSRARETAALKIRTMEGIDFGWFRVKTGLDFLKLEEKTLPKLLEEGLIGYSMNKNIRTGAYLTRKGILFCDIVSSAFL